MRGCSRCGATFAPGIQFCPNDGAPTTEVPPGTAPPDPFLNKMVGNFQLTRRLGSGAMGAVYEGLNPLVGIRVAVKILGGQLALEQELVNRFFAEARALNQIAHENIVRVIDLGMHPEGFYYCVMELLEGQTLAAAMHSGMIELERALTLLAQGFDALGAAHAKGIVHRDLKPTNMMLVHHPVTGAEMLKIVDFGIAKLQKAQSGTATATGMIMGTPAYMSPEQASGRVQDVDGRSDLYAMGLVAYELVTGRHPFEGRAVGELIVAQMTEVPEPAGSFNHLPPRLDDLLSRLLQKAKEQRPDSATSVATELRGILHSLSAPEEYVPPPQPAPRMIPAEQVIRVEPPPPTPVREPTPTPVRIPSKREPPTPARRPVATSAMRPVAQRRPRARFPFVFAFLLIAALFGVTYFGYVNVEPVVGDGAAMVGIAPPSVSFGNTAMPVQDGTAAAYLAAPVLLDCRPTFDGLRDENLPTQAAELRRTLLANLAAYNRLEECFRSHEKALPPGTEWVPPYLQGVAAYSQARALDRLPKAAKEIAQQVKDPDSGTQPFEAVLFARRATEAFSDARPDAPEVHQSLIDAFQRALDQLRSEARSEAAR